MPEATWRDLPPAGAVLEPGNSARRLTGGWRVYKPVVDEGRCIGCLLCWAYCPDSAVTVVDRGGRVVVSIDYGHCKGCGICAEECPVKAISMAEEGGGVE